MVTSTFYKYFFWKEIDDWESLASDVGEAAHFDV